MNPLWFLQHLSPISTRSSEKVMSLRILAHGITKIITFSLTGQTLKSPEKVFGVQL